MTTFSLTDTYIDYFAKAKHFDKSQKIRSKSANNVAYGAGAIRQYINHILDDMVSADIIQINGFFLQFNPQKDFLNNKTNMRFFCKLILVNIQVDGTLPFHLGPHILEILRGPMDLPILEYFYDKMYPSMSKMLETDYEKTCQELGYTVSEGYLRDKLTKSVTGIDWLFAVTIRVEMNFLTKSQFRKYTHIDIDNMLSGEYQITHQMVLKITLISPEYSKLWTEFVNQIPQSKLTDMLYYFTNNKSCDQIIQIIVDSEFVSDIKIETCFNVVRIAKPYFQDLDTLCTIQSFWSGSEYKNADISDYQTEQSNNLMEFVGRYSGGIGIYIPRGNHNESQLTDDDELPELVSHDDDQDFVTMDRYDDGNSDDDGDGDNDDSDEIGQINRMVTNHSRSTGMVIPDSPYGQAAREELHSRMYDQMLNEMFENNRSNRTDQANNSVQSQNSSTRPRPTGIGVNNLEEILNTFASGTHPSIIPRELIPAIGRLRSNLVIPSVASTSTLASLHRTGNVRGLGIRHTDTSRGLSISYQTLTGRSQPIGASRSHQYTQDIISSIYTRYYRIKILSVYTRYRHSNNSQHGYYIISHGTTFWVWI